MNIIVFFNSVVVEEEWFRFRFTVGHGYEDGECCTGKRSIMNEERNNDISARVIVE